MSSCSGIGLSSSTSIFSGGLCSGNTRRPSMFTAKYRLREERKKVLKVSLNKVRRIEDPESFLRRSVLINNTVKRLQREVREEKMVRNGGYMSKLSSMHSFRKSFASSRLQELVHADDLIDDSSSITNSSIYGAPPPPFSNHNSRKRPLTQDHHIHHSSDSDVEEVLSQIYIPPTPCIIPAIEQDHPTSNTSLQCLSSSTPQCPPQFTPEFPRECPPQFPTQFPSQCSSESHPESHPISHPESHPEGPSEGKIKKPRLSNLEEDHGVTSLPTDPSFGVSSGVSSVVSSEASSGVSAMGVHDFEIDVNVVGDEHNRNWNSGTLESETIDEVMDEFRLDFHLTSPSSSSVSSDGYNSVSSASTSTESPEYRNNEQGSQVPKLCEEKENTCDASPILSLSCCPPVNVIVPLADLPVHQHKCPSPTNILPTNILPTNGNPESSSPSSEKQQQFSSCGHSSIFGELQSVVFHSLIASLET